MNKIVLPNLNTNKFDPSLAICNSEFKVLFLNFCSLMCVINNKKLNLANIFLFLLKDEDVNNMYKTMCEFDHDYEAYKSFLEFDSSLHKSKYIKKYLNSRANK